MRKTIIVSDLTGTEFASDVDVSPVKITVSGKSGQRDLTPEETDALTAWVSADAESLPAARDALRALLAPAAPAPAAKSKPKSKSNGSKGADPRNVAIREWVKSDPTRVGLPADHDFGAGRGRLPAEWGTAYDTAHAA